MWIGRLWLRPRFHQDQRLPLRLPYLHVNRAAVAAAETSSGPKRLGCGWMLPDAWTTLCRPMLSLLIQIAWALIVLQSASSHPSSSSFCCPRRRGGYLCSLVQFVYRLLPIPYPIPHAPKRRRHPTACQLQPRPHSSCRSLTSLSTRDDEKDSDERPNFGNSCSSVSDTARTRMLLPLLPGLVAFSSPGVDMEKRRRGAWLIVGSEPSPSHTVVFVALSGGLIVSTAYAFSLLAYAACLVPHPFPPNSQILPSSHNRNTSLCFFLACLLAFFLSFLAISKASRARTHTHTNRRILLRKREETKLVNWLWQRCWSLLQNNRSTTTQQAAPTTQPRTPRDPPFFVKLETSRLPRRCFRSTTSASRTALGRRNWWTRTAGVLLLITMRSLWVLESTFHGAPCHGIHKRKPTNTSSSVATSPFKHSNPQKQQQQQQKSVAFCQQSKPKTNKQTHRENFVTEKSNTWKGRKGRKEGGRPFRWPYCTWKSITKAAATSSIIMSSSKSHTKLNELESAATTSTWRFATRLCEASSSRSWRKIWHPSIYLYIALLFWAHKSTYVQL